jgi:hypothetical protein
MWHRLSSDITVWAHGCLTCQQGKIHCHTQLAPQPIPIPQWSFYHLHVDLVGPLQYSNNFNYIFTIIDRKSKWMEAVPLSETSAAPCTKAVTFTWISHFGVSKTITSDHGPQFTSNLWLQLCGKQVLIILSRTAQLKDCTAASRMRFVHVPLRRYGPRSYPLYSSNLHAQPREDNGLSLDEEVFGAPIELPNEFLQIEEISVYSIIKIFSKTFNVPAVSLPRHNSSTQLPSELPAELLSAPLVWVCRGGVIPPLQPLYDSPCAVLHRGPCSFTIRVRSGDEVIVVSHLKACMAADTTPGSLQCHSRPLGSCQAILPQPSRSHFQTRWYLHFLPWHRLETVRNRFPTR